MNHVSRVSPECDIRADSCSKRKEDKTKTNNQIKRTEMKKKLLSLLLLGGLTLTAGAQQIVTQIPNSNFNGDWNDCYPWSSTTNYSSNEKVVGIEPYGWHISNIYNSSLTAEQTTVGAKTTDVENDFSVTLTNKGAMGQSFPAYISLGTPWSTAQAKLFGTIKEGSADGGVFGGLDFDQKPDAVRLSYKRSLVDGSSERASVITYLWAGEWKQSSVPANVTYNFKSYLAPTSVDMVNRDRNVLFGTKGTVGGDITQMGELIAKKEFYITGATADWTEQIIPLEYLSNSTPEKLNIIIASNDFFADRSGITQDNTLSVDDISLIYYSTLKGLSYNGESLTIPAAGGTVDKSTVVYDESKLACTANGQSATITKTYDAVTNKLTITVSNVDADIDGLSSHTYYIQFAKPGTAALTDLKYNGTTLAGFSSSAYEYTLEGSKYTEGCLTYTKEDGEDATANVSFTGENGYGVATITVTATYGGASKTYTVNFVKPLALLTASFEGTALAVDASQTINVNSIYSADGWTFTTSGSNALVSKKYNVETGLLEVVVMQMNDEGEIKENYIVYNYQFNEPESVVTYNETLTVNVYGMNMTSESPIKIAEMSDGTYMLGLSDFILTDLGLPVGDIVVDGLAIVEENGINVFKYNDNVEITKTIQLAPGSSMPYNSYAGPMLGDVPLTMSAECYDECFHTGINIVMASMGDLVINVTAGTDIVAQTQSAALAETGEAHVVLNRQFLKGWNTICLPFATTPEAVAGTGAKAQAFAGAGVDGLDFVVAETMTANTPYLIYVPADTEAQTFIANVTLEEATPASVTYGDFTFKGNYVANMPMADLYGVADKDGVQKIMKGSATAKLQGTRAYFDYSGTSSVSGMRLNLEGQDDVTSIDGVEVMNGSFDIYNLQGIRVRTAATSLEGLGRGVYVVNGKKVMVK